MSVKKIALIAAASAAVLASGVSFAGGYAAAPVASNSGVYVDVNAGMFLRDVKDNSTFTQENVTGGTISYDNGQSGFTVGGDLGYQFNKTWSVELGFNWLENQKMTVGSGVSVLQLVGQDDGLVLDASDTLTVKSWMFDGAIKGSMPLMDSVSAFAKLGVAYTHNEVSFYNSDATTTYKQDTNYWNPMFGAGLRYDVAQNWNVSFEYTYVPGGDDWSKVVADQIATADAGAHHFPGVHGLTLSAGYFFAM